MNKNTPHFAVGDNFSDGGDSNYLNSDLLNNRHAMTFKQSQT